MKTYETIIGVKLCILYKNNHSILIWFQKRDQWFNFFHLIYAYFYKWYFIFKIE